MSSRGSVIAEMLYLDIKQYGKKNKEKKIRVKMNWQTFAIELRK